MNYADYDTSGGSEDLVQSCLQDLANEGFDCASVDLLMRMAADGDVLDLADVLGGLVAAKHPQDAGEILRMIMFSGNKSAKTEPDYATAAGILSLMVERNLDAARQISPYLLVYQQQGPDCYDVAFTIGHMVKARKGRQAAQVRRGRARGECVHAQSSCAVTSPQIGAGCMVHADPHRSLMHARSLQPPSPPLSLLHDTLAAAQVHDLGRDASRPAVQVASAVPAGHHHRLPAPRLGSGDHAAALRRAVAARLLGS